MRSGLCLWMRAQRARPSFQLRHRPQAKEEHREKEQEKKVGNDLHNDECFAEALWESLEACEA